MQDYAGNVHVTQAVISSKSGFIDVRKYIVSMSIFESIHTPFVYIELNVIDFEELALRVPLIGEEYFTVSYKTNEGKEVSYQFFLYKYDEGAISSLNTSQVFCLKGVTFEKAFDTTKTVSRSYRGNYSSIASDVYEDFLIKDTGKDISVEASKSITKVVFPLLTPLQAIEFCRQRAVPNGTASPYFFFQNSDGYKFVSLNTLFNREGIVKEDVTHVYGVMDANPAAPNTTVIGGKVYKNDIIDFEMRNKYDTLSKIDNGVYNNISFSYDLTTKQYITRREFNMSENMGKFQFGNEGEFNTSGFIRTFDNTALKRFNTVVDFSLELEFTQPNFYPEAVGEINSYALQVSDTNVKMLMYGDTNITAGKVIAVHIASPSGETNKRKQDPMQSGNYLIASIRHDITLEARNYYRMSISAIKGNNIGSIEDIQNGR